MGFVTPDYGTIFWMVIIFGITLFILKKFAWRPILTALKDRENNIAEALASADKARKEVAKMKTNQEAILDEARKEKNEILKEARELKTKIIDEAKTTAHAEGLKIVETARLQIEAEKTAAITEMKKQLVDLSVLVAEKIIQQEFKTDKNQEKLVEKLIKDLKFN
ncbi:F0F1 ATP synthase subunit B [Mangrovibacterium marinum]|uniref:ATP synthase subunit b n=1 Tax=Mangrovibacterium marinum TaxID=1639118 RepID=A0A2T5C6E1_9BACT|nr:F0F1 ATP synthase subunit B [Mangrovibacterium marinum]PTN10515.1 ATP synthase F0 subcomplex B subunit [Mangrovibacterium marinum]